MTPEEKRLLSEQMALPRLLWGMIIRPRPTLEYLDTRGGRTWWLPALLAVLLVVLSVVVAAPITARLARESALEAQEQMFERMGREISAEEQAEIEQSMSIVASPLITTIFPAVGGVVGLAVGWLVWAGALYLAGTALGGRSSFGQVFRVVVWTWLPFAMRALLQTVVILATGQTIIHAGLSGLVRRDVPVSEIVGAPVGLGLKMLKVFLSSLDLFLAWRLVLLVIGVAVTTRLARKRAILITLGVWVLLTLLSLLPVLVGGLFATQLGLGAAP